MTKKVICEVSQYLLYFVENLQAYAGHLNSGIFCFFLQVFLFTIFLKVQLIYFSEVVQGTNLLKDKVSVNCTGSINQLHPLPDILVSFSLTVLNIFLNVQAFLCLKCPTIPNTWLLQYVCVDAFTIRWPWHCTPV